MSAIIKAQASHSVRPYDGSARLRPIAEPAETASTENARETALTLEIEKLRKELGEVATAAERAKLQAYDEGRHDGLATAARDEESRLAALSAGITAAFTDLADRMEALEGLAALLSKTALAKMFEATADQSQLVVGTIARQMQQLRREALVTIQVSADDFPNETALKKAAEAASIGSLSIIASPDLTAGECRIDLQLGHVDIGPRTQWARLETLLHDLATEAGGP